MPGERRDDRYGPNGVEAPRPAEGGEPEITDAELVHYLDGELEGNRRAALEARIAAAPLAAERLETLSRRTARLSGFLTELDPPAARTAASAAALRARLPAGPLHARPWWQHASLARGVAAAAVVAGLILIVPPARAWMVERARDVAAALGFLPTEPPAEAPPSAPLGADLAVSFAVEAAGFDVHVPDPAGVLVVRQGTDAVGTAEASGGGSFVILPEGIRVEDAAAGAVYQLTLPSTVTTVSVRSADLPAVTYPLPAPGAELRVELGP